MGKLKSIWSIESLRNKILFTIAMLFLFRLGCGITVPFVNAEALDVMFNTGNTFDYLNLISGGALVQCAVFALGVTPYINASIVMQLLCVAIPALEKIKKEDDGRKKIEDYTRIMAVVMSVVLGFGYYMIIKRYGALQYTEGLTALFSGLVIVSVFAAGAQLVTWLGGLIDKKGLGNGVSLIIFAGITARWSTLYSTVMTVILNVSAGNWKYLIFGFGLILFVIASICLVVYVNGSERRIPVIYAKRVVGRKQYGGNSSYIPFKLIMSGVLPVIFASTLLSLPQTIAMFINPEKHQFIYDLFMGFNATSWLYCILYVTLIFAFNFFYISIQYDPVEMANNLRKNGGTILGIRPGKETSKYISNAMNKLAYTGSFYLALIAIAPIIVGNLTGLSVQLGGTSLIIVVSVATELLASINSQLETRHRKGFLK